MKLFVVLCLLWSWSWFGVLCSTFSPQDCTDSLCFDQFCSKVSQVDSIHYAITSLMTSERIPFLLQNKLVIPNLEIWRGVNGYDVNETFTKLQEAVDEGIKFKYIQFRTFGTVANWLTKRIALKNQICCRYPYVVLIEDDVKLTHPFTHLISQHVSMIEDGLTNHKIPGEPGFLCLFAQDREKCYIRRYMKWGEVYLISLSAAQKMMQYMTMRGITHNIDNEWLHNGVGVVNLTHPENYLQLLVSTNKGDILKTDPLNTADFMTMKMMKPRENHTAPFIPSTGFHSCSVKEIPLLKMNEDGIVYENRLSVFEKENVVTYIFVPFWVSFFISICFFMYLRRRKHQSQ
jgi:GR25 family glycosyltransferase involved in LPS biosynthesis